MQKPLFIPSYLKHIFLYIWRTGVVLLVNLLMLLLILSEKSF